MNKKNSKWMVLGGAILIIVVSIISLTHSSTNNTGTTCKNIQVPYDSQEEYLKTEQYTESVPYTAQECIPKELPYSIENFHITESICNQDQDICNKYFLGFCTDKTTFCIDKTVSCSLDIKNVDSSERGIWGIQFNFYVAGTSNIIKTTNSMNYLVYPQGSNTAGGNTRITSSGVSGDANQRITCSYNVVNTPTKQVCKDVLKYKDVPKERQVTAYRPVTKYRNEQKCN